MSSTLYTAVPACCISWVAASDSSYFLVIFPVKNEKMRTCRSGRENVTNDDESGESVIHVGVDFDWKGFSREWGYEDEKRARRTFLNSYKSVWVLNDHNPGTLFGNSNCSPGLQYSTKPPSSAEMTQSNLSLYYLGVSD